MKKAQFEIFTAGNKGKIWELVTGEQLGIWGIHGNRKDLYTVTHIPSGYKVVGGISKMEAKRLAIALHTEVEDCFYRPDPDLEFPQFPEEFISQAKACFDNKKWRTR